MIKSLMQLFAAFTSFFVAAEKLGNTAVNLATWAEEGSAQFSDEARMTRAMKMAEFKRKLAAAETAPLEVVPTQLQQAA